MKILVADDQETLREFYTRAFDAQGKEIQVCGDGQACLDMLREETYDILFLDLIMPIMDGESVLRIVKEEFPDMKVVVASVQDDEHAIKELFELGATAYLTKPFTVEQLNEVVQQLTSM